MKTFMIFGHQQISDRYYDIWYRQLIINAFSEPDSVFVIGAADGVDTMAQKQLFELCKNNSDFHRVTIHNKGDKDGRIDSRFSLVNGYPSYPSRDIGMVALSTNFIYSLKPELVGFSGCTFIVLIKNGVQEDIARNICNELRSSTKEDQ